MDTIRSMVKSNTLPAIVLNSRTMRFRREDIEALIEQHATTKGPA
jgi:excisionase family DNA binding protein